MSYLSPKKKTLAFSPYDLKFRGRKRADNVRITVFTEARKTLPKLRSTPEELRVYRDSLNYLDKR